MSAQLSLLQKFMQRAEEKEREMIPKILVPIGVDTNTAIQKAIVAGFPVTYGSPRFVAPSVQSRRSR